MPIEWSDQLSVGHDAIDADHRHLIGLLNEFEAARDLVHAEVTARRLFIYAQTHFDREEAVQLACDYPLYEEHRLQHRALVEQLNKIIRSHFNAHSRDRVEIVEQIHRLLTQWIVRHVVDSDLKMKPYIAKMPR